MKNITENNSIYDTINNELDIGNWIKNNLSTSKKFINANYTKNNFALLKLKYPEIWKQIEGKTVEYFDVNGIKNKFSFVNKCYSQLIYNNVVVSSSSIWKNKNMHVLIENTNNNSSLKDIIQICILNNLSGVQIFKIAKKAFPEEYNVLQQIRLECSHDREAIYCYFHGKSPIKCNSKKLTFRTLSTGYSYEALAEFSNANFDKLSLSDFLIKLITIDPFSVVNFIKIYYPEIHYKVLYEYPSKNESESYHLFAWGKDKPDKCLLCNKSCNFKNLSFGYYSMCSTECARVYTGMQNRKYKDPELWNEYKKLIDYYSNVSYKKYKNLINPHNHKRGIKDYHLDHIIPKVYGFEHGIDPKRISHYANLQMLSSVDNIKKHAKIDNILFVDCILKLTEYDLEYLTSHDSKIL